MRRRSASPSVRAEAAEVTVDVEVWASAEVGVVRLAEGPSGRHREAAASGEDTEETRLDESSPTYQHTGRTTKWLHSVDRRKPLQKGGTSSRFSGKQIVLVD